MFTSERDDWETPRALFEELDSEFGFTLDPCSTHANAKCERHFTAEEDGLSKDWTGERVFMNPPYGKEIAKWVEKAASLADALEPGMVAYSVAVDAESGVASNVRQGDLVDIVTRENPARAVLSGVKVMALKVVEEAAEVFGAWQACMGPGEEAFDMLVDEIADCVTACANLAAALGVCDLAPAVNAAELRNEERGRYEEEAGGEEAHAPVAGVPMVRVLDEGGREVLRGWYVYHESRQRYCFGGGLADDDVCQPAAVDGFADWGMPRELELKRITPPHRIEVVD